MRRNVLAFPGGKIGHNIVTPHTPPAALTPVNVMNRKTPAAVPSSVTPTRFSPPASPQPRPEPAPTSLYRTVEVEEDPRLAELKGKLVTAALEFMEHVAQSTPGNGGTEEISSLDCFDMLPNGSRIVIELGVLPPPTAECEGAFRAEPPPTGLLRLNRN